MKSTILALALLFIPCFVQAAEVNTEKFSSYNIDIPKAYEIRKTNTALEIHDTEKKNILMILVLPDAKKDLVEYTEALSYEYKGSEVIFNEDEESYSFTFNDGTYGECIAITKEAKKKFLFITVGGKETEKMLKIANSLR